MVHVLAMAKFELGEGEVELLREAVDCVVEGKRMPNGALVITDKRVVLLTPKGPSPGKLMAWLGPLVGRVAATAVGPLAMTHQIKRGDFAEVEEADGKMLVFRNKGSGYAHVSFEVTSMTTHDVWQQRMT